ncbi:MAG: CYTH domain-containing protein [Bacteroides sp.]|nr:CYTH domain-containing protein [Bacteroides sp.]
MNQEIERKFLVTGEYKSLASSAGHIIQGYISSVPERMVRIRIRDEKAYITIKGASAEDGKSRYEWEKELSLQEGYELMNLCEPGSIDKTRYLIPYQEHLFEVDEFHGENSGLVIAEVELSSPDEKVSLPGFIGEEVTGDIRYYNSYLKKCPYSSWPENQ